ncbi:MAG: bifunctional DNA-formamidopyrimidine glycosylase/DNA-(apurinic or apyrimidinic site) lyase [Candidatus Pacebacteria bacterium]|nr:bifunctional DNA-formamidopyrimidine glycosylase/DNA-(apurinic or apyrimidinic site) lyase [Candidatus Paceibacterota bacterium]
MPELPEVHTTSEDLRPRIVGREIVDIWSGYDSPYRYGKNEIKDPKFFKKFRTDLIGSKIKNTGRVGKNVLIHTNKDQTILVHMKMTGHLLHGKYAYDKKKKEWLATEEGPLRDDPWNGHIRFLITLDDGNFIALSDTRKFAKITLFKTSEMNEHPDVKILGPNPIADDFTFKIFQDRITRRKTWKIKQALLDQELIAGIGNIYSDESLWMAKIHPKTLVHKLDKISLKNLYKAIREVLKKGIDFGGDSMQDYRTPSGEKGRFQLEHQVYQRKNKDCLRKNCKDKIARMTVGGRGTHYCPTCQTETQN